MPNLKNFISTSILGPLPWVSSFSSWVLNPEFGFWGPGILGPRAPSTGSESESPVPNPKVPGLGLRGPGSSTIPLLIWAVTRPFVFVKFCYFYHICLKASILHCFNLVYNIYTEAKRSISEVTKFLLWNQKLFWQEIK